MVTDRDIKGIKRIILKIKRIIFKRRAIEQSIAHWERMIKWMEENQSDTFDRDSIIVYMKICIKENWGGEYCSLCKIFTCGTCPLGKKYASCSSHEGIWRGVNLSNSKPEWLLSANKLLAALKTLL